MLNATERRTLRTKLERYEGRVPHMYLDSRGYVTVGVGHLISTKSAAIKLLFLNGRRMAATVAEISEDFDGLRKQPAAMRASFYRGHVKLSLADDKIDRLTEQHIDSFHGELRVIYKGFDQYPSSVRLALFDMIFNLARPGCEPGGRH